MPPAMFFIAGDEVFIYDREGKPVGVLEVPERSGSLAFGGADRRTMFIGAHSSLLDPYENGRALISRARTNPGGGVALIRALKTL
jgi:sugar lactone lactonase YvrE